MKSNFVKILIFAGLYAATAAGTGLFFDQANGDSKTEADEVANEDGSTKEKKPPYSPVAVALRPGSSASIEAIAEMSDTIRRTELELADRQKQLEQEEERIKVLFEDLALERDELKSFGKSLDIKLQEISNRTDQLRGLLDEIDTREKALQSLAKQTGTDEQSVSEELESRVNDVKSWFSNLEANQAADYLREFANNGKLEFAAALLQKLPDRSKAKILGAMNDAALVDQLIEALSTSK